MADRRPTDYYVQYEDCFKVHELEMDEYSYDPALTCVIQDASTLEEAREIAQRLAQTRHHKDHVRFGVIQIYRRYDFVDKTPSDFPVRGWLWEWEEDFVEDVP